MKEIWVDIVGYETYYQISSIGRVKRLKTHMGRPIDRLVYGDRSGKYERVTLCLNGLKTCFTVHHLVCSAFWG